MLVRCIHNDFRELADPGARERIKESVHLDGPDESLAVGQSYLVMAVDQWSNGGIHVYLHSIPESDHPHPYPLEMFELIDSSVPAGWCVGFVRQGGATTIRCISFSEWVTDDSFYEKMVDGDQRSVETYRRERAAVLGSHISDERRPLA